MMKHFWLCRIITPINGSFTTSSTLLRCITLDVYPGGGTHSCLMTQKQLRVAPLMYLFSLEGGCKMHVNYRLPLYSAYVLTCTSLSPLTPPPPHSPMQSGCFVVMVICLSLHGMTEGGGEGRRRREKKIGDGGRREEREREKGKGAGKGSIHKARVCSVCLLAMGWV